MKPTKILVLLIGIIIADSASAQIDKISGYLQTGPQKDYMGRRISRDLYRGWMEWSELDLNYRGFFVNIWDSTEIDKHLPNVHGGDEMDFTAGWRGDIGNGFKLRLSTTLFNLYPKDVWWTKDTAVQSLWLSRDFVFGKHTLRPEMRLEWISKTSDFGGGALVTLPNLTHLWSEPLGIRKLTLVNQSTLARDDGFDGPKNNSQGLFYRWDGALSWKLLEHWDWVFPSVTLQVPFNNPHDGRGQQELSYGTYLRFSFGKK